MKLILLQEAIPSMVISGFIAFFFFGLAIWFIIHLNIESEKTRKKIDNYNKESREMKMPLARFSYHKKEMKKCEECEEIVYVSGHDCKKINKMES